MTRTFLTAAALTLGIASLSPDAQAQTAPKYFFEGDIVRAQLCVTNNQFKRNEPLVFRIRVTNPLGAQADDKRLKSLQVELADGTKLPMKYGSHPKGQDTDKFWTVAWIVPADYPTGTLSWKVTASDMDSQSQSWSPFNVKPSQLTIVE